MVKKIIAGFFFFFLLYGCSTEYVPRYFFVKYKRKLDFSNPIVLDEKIQWMKFNLYTDNQLITQCVDKYAVRKYVAKCGCEEILNELYAAYDTVDEIQWDKLPDQFVIKWNFGCGQNLICRDKSKLDIEKTKKLLRKWRKAHKYFYLGYVEMQYKNIIPKLICEKLIETEDNSLPIDYKLYCFNGEAKYLMMCVGRGQYSHPKLYFVNSNCELERLNITGINAPEDLVILKPDGFEKLFYYADALSKPFPFVRADFYLEKGKVIFGELTFTPSGGLDTNIPYEQNKFLGSLVNLSYRGNN